MYRFGFTFSNEVIIKKRIDWMIKVVLQENSIIIRPNKGKFEANDGKTRVKTRKTR